MFSKESGFVSQVNLGVYLNTMVLIINNETQHEMVF